MSQRRTSRTCELPPKTTFLFFSARRVNVFLRVVSRLNGSRSYSDCLSIAFRSMGTNGSEGDGARRLTRRLIPGRFYLVGGRGAAAVIDVSTLTLLPGVKPDSIWSSRCGLYLITLILNGFPYSSRFFLARSDNQILIYILFIKLRVISSRTALKFMTLHICLWSNFFSHLQTI